MIAHEQNNAHSRGDGVWIVALAVLCLGIFGYGYFFSSNTVSDPAFLAGQYLVYALVVWGIFYAIFVRKYGAKISAVAFIAIYGSLFFGGLIGVSQQKQQAVKALSSVQQEMARITNKSLDSSGLPTRVERSPATIPQANGEFGEMERFMKEHMDRVVTQRNDYLLEVEAIGWDSILDAQRIKNDARLSESKVMIERAKAIVDKYEKKTAGLMQDTRLRIGATTMSGSTKKKILEGFDDGFREAGAQIDKQWNLEKQVIREFENIVLLLATSKGWIVEGGQILFYSDAELSRFNSYIQRIQQIVQQQEQIQKNSYAKVNQRLEAARNAAAR